jgi:hypothetical protein
MFAFNGLPSCTVGDACDEKSAEDFRILPSATDRVLSELQVRGAFRYVL